MPNGRKPGEAAPRGFTSTGKPRTTRAERQAAKEQKRLDDAATEERVRGEAAEAAAGMRTPTVVANMEVKNVIQLEQIEQAKAEIRARARGLTEDLLDSHTVALLDSKETPAAVKATLLGTAYKRFGMLKEKVENTGANGAPMAFQLIRLSGKKESDGADPDPSL